jgi:hypothetical protein
MSAFELSGLVLALVGIAFAFETPRRKFVALFRHRAQTPHNLLVVPKFRLTQVGFSGGGLPHKVEYSFLLKNIGGDCFDILFSSGQSTVCAFPRISRGNSHKFRMTFDSAPHTLDVLLKGLDENGIAFSQIFAGTRQEMALSFNDVCLTGSALPSQFGTIIYPCALFPFPHSRPSGTSPSTLMRRLLYWPG